MIHTLSLVLFGCAGFGLLLYAIQLAAVVGHRRGRYRLPAQRPGISILKPLCGLDDDLAENLECFVALPYERFELVLGVRDRQDAAYPTAALFARRHPGKVRLVLQDGMPGLNPKVAQLIGMARAACHDILVVSDSNVRVADDYLLEIAAHFEDRRVGLVTHPVVGVDEARFGSLMDNLHLASAIGAGMIGAKRVVGQDVVVGKSMAFRRADLAALGGFEVVADVLAEDFVLGRMVSRRLGKRVVVAGTPVFNVSRRRDAREFYRRYARWSVIHRQAIGASMYAGQSLLNPTLFAAAALAVDPGRKSLFLFALVALLKLTYDGAALHFMRGGRVPLATVVASPAKDALLAVAWASGLVRRHVDWRGNSLRVLPGTRLQAPVGFVRTSRLTPTGTALPSPAWTASSRRIAANGRR
jgi:ceramide glucosyltransferase